MNELKETVCIDDAEWDISLNVECPHCGHYYDLTDYETMGELPEVRAHDDLAFDTVCPECSREYRITKITT